MPDTAVGTREGAGGKEGVKQLARNLFISLCHEDAPGEGSWRSNVIINMLIISLLVNRQQYLLGGASLCKNIFDNLFLV